MLGKIVKCNRQFLSITSFFVLLFLTSCTTQVDDGTTEPEKPEPISYLALGDSYTIGQSVEEDQRWPNQLSVKLAENGLEVSKTRIIAKTGWTTSNLLTAIENTDLDTYNLVSLLIGANNQYQRKDFSIFENEFDSLLNIAIALAGLKDRVFVVSIPDYGVTPFGNANKEQIAIELDKYNQYSKDKCFELGILYVNITDISRGMGSKDGALASDNLHPSGKQYTQWTERILPKVLKILE